MILFVLLALVIGGCGGPQWYATPKKTESAVMVYEETQFCQLDNGKGDRYFVFSTIERKDVCADFK